MCRYFEEDWEERCDEVYFPGRHIAHLPWKELQLEKIPLPLPLCPYQGFTVTIKALSHVTHNEQFAQICTSHPINYILMPRKKMGKSGYEKYDGSPIGHSFAVCDPSDPVPNRESLYRHIKPRESLLSGNYMWWSVKCDEVPSLHWSSQFLSYKASHPFLDFPESPYGNWEISGYIKYVLEAYQSSLPRDSNNRGKFPRLELRNGGTLRYKFEVCHIIIVCAAYVRKPLPLPLDKYPLWNEGRGKIEYNSYTGAITFVHPLKITYKNGVKYCEGQIYSWDNFVFTFHFPDETQVMKCPKDPERFNWDEVTHYECIKTRPNGQGKFLCPNEF